MQAVDLLWLKNFTYLRVIFVTIEGGITFEIMSIQLRAEYRHCLENESDAEIGKKLNRSLRGV
jgi:hypothetical protein